MRSDKTEPLRSPGRKRGQIRSRMASSLRSENHQTLRRQQRRMTEENDCGSRIEPQPPASDSKGLRTFRRRQRRIVVVVDSRKSPDFPPSAASGYRRARLWVKNRTPATSVGQQRLTNLSSSTASDCRRRRFTVALFEAFSPVRLVAALRLEPVTLGCRSSLLSHGDRVG